MSTVEERVRAERDAQGLITPAAPTGDVVVDARVAAAYRATATVLTSATTTSPDAAPDRRRVDATDEVVIGAAGPQLPVVGEQTTGRTTSNKRATAQTVALQDNAAS